MEKKTEKMKFEKLSTEEKVESTGGLQPKAAPIRPAPSFHPNEPVKAHNRSKTGAPAQLKARGGTALGASKDGDSCWHMYGCSLC